MRDEVQKWRGLRSVRLSLLWYSVACRKQQENRLQQVKSTRTSPLAFSLFVSQPRSFSYSSKMVRNAKYALFIAMALGGARQAAGETLTSKSGPPCFQPDCQLAPSLLSITPPSVINSVQVVAVKRWVALVCPNQYVTPATKIGQYTQKDKG